MIAQGFKIKWEISEEYIPFDFSRLKDPPRTITSIDFRSDIETRERKCVKYIVLADTSHIGDDFRIRLRYERANQEDAYAEENSVWGGLEIFFNPVSNTCSALWVGDELSEEDEGNKLISVEAIGYRESTARTKVSRMVIVRPLQSDLRKALLTLDEACVLSGEIQAESLEAAHILPVAENGTEEIENAILLRADLHCLYDAGMFWFSVFDEKAEIRISDELVSIYYRQLLDGLTMPPEVFERVSRSLKLREKLITAQTPE